MLEYQVYLQAPAAHLFRVVLECDVRETETCTLKMAAWIPGSYMIRDFARNVVALRAQSGGKKLRVEKKDKQTWRIAQVSGRLVIEYDVYAYDLSVRGSFLDTTRAFITGTSLFIMVEGCEQEECEVEFFRPEGGRYTNWKLATTLPRLRTEYLEFGRYRADNYTDLIDHPVEMGHFVHDEFSVAGTIHNIQISGRQAADLPRICADLEKICTQHAELFGGLPEMERYLFQVLALGEGYGGLEHRNSTSLICQRTDLPSPNSTEIDEGYRRFLGLCSHEYFHLWNVKRIRPKALKDADLSCEVHTTLLWAFEGITSYYDDLALVRSGVIDEQSYLELLAQSITRHLGGSGRFLQSVAESSFDAWTKFYKQDENAPNAIVSYYNKGALVAMILDLTLREERGGGITLDHVMRRLWDEFGRRDIGLEEDDIERTIAEVSGLDLTDFFQSYIYGLEKLPLEEMLATVGVAMQLAPKTVKDEKGGFAAQRSPVSAPSADIGARITADPLGLKVSVVFTDGPAQQAGVSAGDVVVAIDGIKASPDELDRQLQRCQPGSTITMHVFRRDELMQFEVEPRVAAPSVCYLSLDEDAGEEKVMARKRWLGSVTI